MGFGVGANSHADGAIRAGFAPELVAGFHLTLPLDDATYVFLFAGFNGFGRAVIGAFFTDLAKMLNAEIDWLFFNQLQIGGDHR